jgi:hypothetical protein
MRRRVLPKMLAAAAVALFLSESPASALDTVPGHVIVARENDDAVLLWDATPDVADIVRERLSDADAEKRLERDALRALATSLDRVPNARTVTLRVLYSKIGDVSPAYGSPTFAGVERYATLTVDARRAAGDDDRWKELGPRSAVPAWIDYEVVGELPPR